MFHRARIPISIGDTVFDESPTIITRLVVESGWMMTGGLATFGIANDRARRSWTSCRARRTSVPGSKVRRIDDRPGTDVEWMFFSHGVPFRSSSRLRVTRSSTSGAERPSASVWTSIIGGANSGSASTGICRDWFAPATSTAVPSATARSLKRRLEPTIHLNMTGAPPPSVDGRPEGDTARSSRRRHRSVTVRGRPRSGGGDRVGGHVEPVAEQSVHEVEHLRRGLDPEPAPGQFAIEPELADRVEGVALGQVDPTPGGGARSRAAARARTRPDRPRAPGADGPARSGARPATRAPGATGCGSALARRAPSRRPSRGAPRRSSGSQSTSAPAPMGTLPINRRATADASSRSTRRSGASWSASPLASTSTSPVRWIRQSAERRFANPRSSGESSQSDPATCVRSTGCERRARNATTRRALIGSDTISPSRHTWKLSRS